MFPFDAYWRIKLDLEYIPYISPISIHIFVSVIFPSVLCQVFTCKWRQR